MNTDAALLLCLIVPAVLGALLVWTACAAAARADDHADRLLHRLNTRCGSAQQSRTSTGDNDDDPHP